VLKGGCKMISTTRGEKERGAKREKEGPGVQSDGCKRGARSGAKKGTSIVGKGGQGAPGRKGGGRGMIAQKEVNRATMGEDPTRRNIS